MEWEETTPMIESETEYICKSNGLRDQVNIVYKVWGKGLERIVLIPGFCCGTDMWISLIKELNQDGRYSILTPENRGFGSTCLSHQQGFSFQNYYTTNKMAQDLWTVVDELLWSTFHLIGFSLGGMIASKVAAQSPHRILSLTLLSTPRYGLQAFIPTWRTFKLLTLKLPLSWLFQYCLLCGRRQCTELSMHTRIFLDVYFQFSDYYLMQLVFREDHSLVNRLQLIQQREIQQRMRTSGSISTDVVGQLQATLFHWLSSREVNIIRRTSFPVLCISGKYDQLVSCVSCKKLARALKGHHVTLAGAHFLVEECAEQVNKLIHLFLLGDLRMLEKNSFLLQA
eukprot:jgi/Galph1/1152/GphlegSOOS_G5915.1